MTQQENSQEGGAGDIRRQFAQLQAEMKRVMAEPSSGEGAGHAPAANIGSETADFERIERGLEDLRRDADRLRDRMAQPAEAPGASETIAALQARVEEIGKRADDSIAWLTRAVQGNREAIATMSLNMQVLARRRPSRWLVPLAILLGAMAIAAAVLVSMPGQMQTLLDRTDAPADASQPPAEITPPAAITEAPAPAPLPPVAPPPAVAALPPPAAPPIAEPPVAPPAPPPAPEAVATTEPTAPIATPAPAPAPATAAPAPAPASAPASRPAPGTAVADGHAPAGQIVLLAKADSWVEVRNRQGGALVARVLRAGETWTVPDQASLVLTTGNAGGLELLVDGNLAPPLGAVGAIRRDVPLDPGLVRAGRYTAEPAVSPKPSTASR